ncbi:hypothetical protein M977_04330 [Buttiauxella gaviniae ATCC 51604]|uniref:DUF6950 domain-containing protein n=1 Tax=Buttiauxella gaviniae ATCC 51604 TaxID=1354253 RepID=A0A1B7HN54_9ENTR|nr:hypothetical protein [Buttiauxella gaviniae]OAT17084.1 hypothetical protein M977_04330 [Buttiauxella gaviniae ATCC 51604]
MFQKQAKITDYINEQIGQPIVYGENDCNLLCLKMVDIETGSDHFNKLVNQYTSVKEGLTKAKKIIGYSNALEIIKDNYEQTDDFSDGCLLVKEHKEGARKVFHVSVVYSGWALTMDNGFYKNIPAVQADYDSIWRIKKCL